MPATGESPDTEPLYARPELYDAIYAGPQHDRETRFVRDAVPEAETVLEVGAGTGEHTRRLADAGRQVTAVEPAAPMRRRAREKVGDREGVTVVDGLLPDLHLEGEFDAVLAVHSVLNYVGPGDLAASVRALADHLAPGGALVADNSALPPADEGNAADYAVTQTPAGPLLRVARMRPLGDRLEWVQVVFPPDGDPLLDRHELTPWDDADVAAALEDAGLAYETHDGYGEDTGERSTDSRTVFVARHADGDRTSEVP
jgi:SAM-dependent methyltransferase